MGKRVLGLALLTVGLFAGCSTQAENNPRNSATAVDQSVNSTTAKPKPAEVWRFVVLGDTHGDTDQFPALLKQIQADKPEFVIDVGDLTKVGGSDEFKIAKAQFDGLGIPYDAVPGDHDIVTGKGLKYFTPAFGKDYQSFMAHGLQFVLVDNADLIRGMTTQQWTFLDQLPSNLTTFVLLHHPPSHPLFKMHTMQETAQGAIDEKRLQTWILKHNVRQVVAGEMHLFQQYALEGGIPLTVVGAAGKYDNPGEDQYVLVQFYTDQTWTIKQKVLGQSP